MFYLCVYLSLFVLGTFSLQGPSSVSGISSGGFFAVQYQFAFSTEVAGVGVFAGGPYYCAQDQELDALTACMSLPIEINVQTLESDAQGFSSDGSIDPISTLAQHKVFLFSGQNDNTVNPGVVRALNQMYTDLGVTQITTNFNTQAGHSFPTTNYGNPCGTTQSPYITNCGFDGAGATLQAIYGTLQSPVTPFRAALKRMSLDQFLPSGTSASSISLDSNFYYYEPASCNGTCAVHVAFAGCQMTYNDIGLDFVTSAGYNGWAEANKIVILYPFTVTSYFSPANPEGCWDWWGYAGQDYSQKTGPQMVTIHNMVRYFQSAHF